MGLYLEGSVEGDLVFGIGVSMAVDSIAGIWQEVHIEDISGYRSESFQMVQKRERNY